MRSICRESLAGAIVALIVVSWSAPATACSYGIGFDPPAKHCERTGPIPANGLVDDLELTEFPPETRALFEPAADVNARLVPCDNASEGAACGFHRLRPGTPGGTVVRSREIWSCAVDRTTEATPDVTPPSTPVLADIVIELKTDPADTGCTSCPDLDHLTIFVTNVRDDRATRKQMLLAIYAGATEEEAKARTTIDHIVPLFEASEVGVGPKRTLDMANGPAMSIPAIVGESVDRARPLDRGLFAGGPRCIAVELMDRAGNLSTRSNAVCFDHTKEDDPAVRTEEGGCACSTEKTPRFGSATLAFVTAMLVARMTKGPSRWRRALSVHRR